MPFDFRKLAREAGAQTDLVKDVQAERMSDAASNQLRVTLKLLRMLEKAIAKEMPGAAQRRPRAEVLRATGIWMFAIAEAEKNLAGFIAGLSGEGRTPVDAIREIDRVLGDRAIVAEWALTALTLSDSMLAAAVESQYRERLKQVRAQFVRRMESRK